MNTTILLSCVGIAALLAGFAVWKSRQKKKPQASDETLTGDQKLYRLGLTPASDKPVMYALLTCQHCKNTRKFLDEAGVKYSVIYLDEFNGQQRADLMEKVRTYNPRGTFPTIILPNGKVIVGFRKSQLQEAVDHAAGRTA